MVHHLLGFVFFIAMHVISGTFFCCHHKVKPVHMTLAISQTYCCGSRDTSQRSAYFISSFSLGSSRLLDMDEMKGKKQYTMCSSHLVSLLASGPVY